MMSKMNRCDKSWRPSDKHTDDPFLLTEEDKRRKVAKTTKTAKDTRRINGRQPNQPSLSP